jgi:glycosyltransferase involved in cell wall biosynthesis
MKPNIIAIGYAKKLFIPGSRERERALLYTKETRSHHVVVFTKHTEQYRDVHDGNFHVYGTHSRFRLLMLWDAFWITKRIIRELITEKYPCIITAQDPLEVGWLSWLIARTSGIYLHIQVHGDYVSSGEWVGHSPLRYVRRQGGLLLLRHVSAIRVASERIKASLVRCGVQAKRITVLPIRPELEVFLHVTRVLKEQEPITFLSLGRLSPEKDIPRIVRAFEIVHKTYPAAKLRIVGEGSERSVIEKLIASQLSSSQIELVPWTDNVPKEMEEADVFLLASKHEAYALTLIEAMATGLPIVTTDVGCVGEVVRDRVHGIVVTNESDDAYATGMKEMCENIVFRKSCSEEGKTTAEKLSAITMNDYAHSWAKSISMSAYGEV